MPKIVLHGGEQRRKLTKKEALICTGLFIKPRVSLFMILTLIEFTEYFLVTLWLVCVSASLGCEPHPGVNYWPKPARLLSGSSRLPALNTQHAVTVCLYPPRVTEPGLLRYRLPSVSARAALRLNFTRHLNCRTVSRPLFLLSFLLKRGLSKCKSLP